MHRVPSERIFIPVFMEVKNLDSSLCHRHAARCSHRPGILRESEVGLVYILPVTVTQHLEKTISLHSHIKDIKSPALTAGGRDIR